MRTAAFPMTGRVVVQFESNLNVVGIIYPGMPSLKKKIAKMKTNKSSNGLVKVIPGEKFLKALSRLTM